MVFLFVCFFVLLTESSTNTQLKRNVVSEINQELSLYLQNKILMHMDNIKLHNSRARSNARCCSVQTIHFINEKTEALRIKVQNFRR